MQLRRANLALVANSRRRNGRSIAMVEIKYKDEGESLIDGQLKGYPTYCKQHERILILVNKNQDALAALLAA